MGNGQTQRKHPDRQKPEKGRKGTKGSQRHAVGARSSHPERKRRPYACSGAACAEDNGTSHGPKRRDGSRRGCKRGRKEEKCRKKNVKDSSNELRHGGGGRRAAKPEKEARGAEEQKGVKADRSSEKRRIRLPRRGTKEPAQRQRAGVSPPEEGL